MFNHYFFFSFLTKNYSKIEFINIDVNINQLLFSLDVEVLRNSIMQIFKYQVIFIFVSITIFTVIILF